jgi:hypothetical protein
MRRANAFTLVEMVLSLAIAALLMGALASLMALTSRALPTGDVGAGAAAQRQRLAELADELSTAKDIQLGTNKFRFTVADRTGDGVDESIEYAWSGVKGDPVQRKMGTSSGAFFEAVSAFAIDFASASRGEPASILRAVPGVTLAQQPASPSGIKQVRPGESAAFLVRPVLAGTVTQWRPEVAKFHASVHPASVGDAMLLVCPSDAAGNPNEAAPLGSVRVVVPSLQLIQTTVTANLPTIPWQDPGSSLWLVLQSNAANTRLNLGSSQPMPDESVVATSSAGVWTLEHDSAATYSVTGTIRDTLEASIPRAITPKATITLATAALPQTTLSVRLANEPLYP